MFTKMQNKTRKNKIKLIAVVMLLLTGIISCGSEDAKLTALDSAPDLFGGVGFDITESEFLALRPNIGAGVTDDEVEVDGKMGEAQITIWADSDLSGSFGRIIVMYGKE